MAVWLSAARSSCRGVVLAEAMGAMAATSKWWLAPTTTRCCISASTPSIPPNAAAMAKAAIRPGATVKALNCRSRSVLWFLTHRRVNSWLISPRPSNATPSHTAVAAGRGNARFATSTHQAPTEHEDGKPGDVKKLRLEFETASRCRLGRFSQRGQIHAHLASYRQPSRKSPTIPSPLSCQTWALSRPAISHS